MIDFTAWGFFIKPFHGGNTSKPMRCKRFSSAFTYSASCFFAFSTGHRLRSHEYLPLVAGLNGRRDIFAARYTAAGDFDLVRVSGNTLDDVATGITLDAQDDAIYTGFFRQTIDVNIGVTTETLTSRGSSDVLLVKQVVVRGLDDATVHLTPADLAGFDVGAAPAPAPWDEVGTSDSDERIVVSHNWDEIRRLMWNYVGIVRSGRRLGRARRRLELINQEIEELHARLAQIESSAGAAPGAPEAEGNQ